MTDAPLLGRCREEGCNHVEVQEAEVRPMPIPRAHLEHVGEVGKHIKGEVTVERKRVAHPDGPDSTLVIYTFAAANADAILTWFCPGQYDPEWSAGSTRTIRAKVKRHEDHERFGKSTIVTYVEEV
jgi:hypothetical protein